MAYKITRMEVFPTEVFVNVEVTDENGFYNFGRWLSPEDAAALKADIAAKKKSEKTYMTEKTSALVNWAESRLIEAKRCKLEDIAAATMYKEEQELQLK